MANVTNIMQSNYNLTKLFSTNPISDPVGWTAAYNNIVGGYFIMALLAVFFVALYEMMVHNQNMEDSSAMVYAGFITTFIAIFIFLLKYVPSLGVKLLSPLQLTIFVVLEFIAIVVDNMRRRY